MSVQCVVFEGLSPFLIGTPNYVKRGLLDPLDLANVSVWRGSFMSKGPLPRIDHKLVVIAHSMGGPSALWWCNKWKEFPVDLLVTLDPRPLHRPYIKPPNVKRAVNFYQTGFMRGYEVKGAENIKVVTAGHTKLPALSAVERLVKGYL